MSIADRIFMITNPNAPVPPIPHLTVAELDTLVNDTPSRVVRREVECAGTAGDQDDWTDSSRCQFAGMVDVAVFDDTEEALWYCPDGHENSIRWETI